MNVVNIGDLDIVCQSRATTSSHKDTKGGLLKDILEKAEIRQNNHKEINKKPEEFLPAKIKYIEWKYFSFFHLKMSIQNLA